MDTHVLDRFAREYYLNEAVDDLDIEERAQAFSVAAVAEAVAGCDRVLEMGYGTGLMTSSLLAAGVPLEVVEGSPVLADLARERHPGLVVHTALFEEFEPVAPYDGVLALHVLEHVEEPVALATRIRSWLAPDGTLVAVCPNRESLHRRLAVLMELQPDLGTLSPRDVLVGHLRVYDAEGLRADLDAAGFDVVEEFGYLLKVLPNAMQKDHPVALLDALSEISEELPPRLLANIGVRAVRREPS